MSNIPMIQPSQAPIFANPPQKRSIFSDPTVDIRGSNPTKDQDSSNDYVATMQLDPSPIGKGTTTKAWARTNRTLEATFRPTTNEIAVFVAGKKSAEEFPVKQHASTKDNTIFLCQASLPNIRIPFIERMFGAFSNISTKDPYQAKDDYKRHFAQYSRGITLYQLELEDKLRDDSMSKDQIVELTKELTLMDGISAIWQLTEFMFFTPDHEKPVAFLFSEWLNIHDPAPSQDSAEILLDSLGKLSHPQFWPYVHQCILRGMRSSVVFMVQQALDDEGNDDTSDALEDFLRILDGIPSSETTIPDGKAIERHRKWQENCKKFAKSSFVTELGDEAITALNIMAGDVESILDATESWEEAFSAIMLYRSPDRAKHELEGIVKMCSARYFKSKDISLLDNIKMAILEMDALKTIRYCGNFHPWLVAHVADALRQHGYLDMSDIQLQDIIMNWDSDIRDYYVISYAQSLMSNPSLWEAIAGYLLNCGDIGKAMLSEWICHVPLDTPEKSRKVMKFCSENNLLDAWRSINRVLAVEEEKEGQYALAIQHFMASNDSQRIAKVTDSLMHAFLSNGDLEQANTLRSLTMTGGALNEHVQFLRAYAEFHADCKKGEFMKAGEILIMLLATGRAPMKYWIVLLFDAVSLLDHEEVVFDSNDTAELMRCLEEVTESPYKQEYLQLLPEKLLPAKAGVEERELCLDTLRLSLVKNLARAFVHRPQTDDMEL